MDHLKKITDFLIKYRYAALVLVIGVILMLIPGGSDDEAETVQQLQTEETLGIAVELEQILCQIQGVGKVQVMLTVEAGELTLYQYDQRGDDRDTVIITDADRAEAGLVQQVSPETYRGAVIVCQGADSPAVRLSVIEAVSKVTGLSTDRISVLKMK